MLWRKVNQGREMGSDWQGCNLSRGIKEDLTGKGDISVMHISEGKVFWAEGRMNAKTQGWHMLGMLEKKQGRHCR